MALLLEKQGVSRVRPLEGGLAAWAAGGHPLESAGTPIPRDV